MKRKILVIIMSIVIATFVGCGNKSVDKNSDKSETKIDKQEEVSSQHEKKEKKGEKEKKDETKKDIPYADGRDDLLGFDESEEGLLDGRPRYAFIRPGNDIERPDMFSLEVDSAVLVKEDEMDLIEDYGLQNASFDNGYELVDDSYATTQLWAYKNGGTSFYLIDRDSEDIASYVEEVGWEEFLRILDGYSEEGMFVKYHNVKDNLYMIREVYLP